MSNNSKEHYSHKAIEEGKWSTTYRYWTNNFELVYVTQQPKTDDEALDHFPVVASHWGKDVTYVDRKADANGSNYVTLPWIYVAETNELISTIEEAVDANSV